MSDFEKEFGWDDEIEKDSDEWVLLPEGDYDFTVTAFERGRHQGSDKLPPCNKAILTLKVEGTEGTTTIVHNLFLHSKTEGMLSAFFCAIGQKKHGEKLRMNWQNVIGSKGRCKVYVDEWTGRDGDKKQSNKIKRFYDPEDVSPQPAGNNTGFTPGKF